MTCPVRIASLESPAPEVTVASRSAIAPRPSLETPAAGNTEEVVSAHFESFGTPATGDTAGTVTSSAANRVTLDTGKVTDAIDGKLASLRRRTQTETLDAVRQFLHLNLNKTSTKGTLFDTVVSLIRLQDKWYHRIQTITHVRVIRMHHTAAVALQIKMTNPKFKRQKWLTLSWRRGAQALHQTQKQVAHNRTPHSEAQPKHNKLGTAQGRIADSVPPTLTSAMRYAVRFQVSGWKKQNYVHRVCVSCGTDGSNSKTPILQADHVIPFKVIRDDFLRSRNDRPTTFGYTSRSRPKFMPVDRKFCRAWQRYHAGRTEFQWLCRSCNCRKGAKQEINTVKCAGRSLSL